MELPSTTQKCPGLKSVDVDSITCCYVVLQAGQFDIENGWSLDERNWAILTATENTVETAEQACSQY